MQVVNQSGLPPMPPGSHQRYRGRRGGFWARFGSQGLGFMINVIGSALGLLAVMGYLVWRFILPHGTTAKAAEQEPPQATIVIQTVAPLPSPDAPAAATPLAVSPLEPIQIAGTATAQALYSRPAAFSNPEAAPFFIGVVTYESGCSVSNLGFTTAGLSGQPYYLYFSQPLARNPLMQMVNITGYTQKFKDCRYPVIMVQQIFWLEDEGTPAPLSGPAVISGTATITATAAWGVLPTPDKRATPLYNPAGWTATPWPTYTPFPSATAYVPPPRPELPTYTPRPTYTPYPTLTVNPATATPAATATGTPETASIYGAMVSVVGCSLTNLAVSAGGQQHYVVLAGAQLPAGSPTDYWALVSGRLDTVCGGPAIRANQIIWYQPPTPTATNSPTPTVTNTATLTPTATIEPTATPTLETAE